MKNQNLRDRTKQFGLRIVRMFCALPKKTEAQVLGKQTLRAGTSVGAKAKMALLQQEAKELLRITFASINTAKRRRTSTAN